MANPEAYKVGFGSPGRTKEFDDAARAKAQGVPRKRVWSKDKIQDFLDEMLDTYKKILMEDAKIAKADNKMKLKAETVRDMNNMMSRLLQFLEKFYPPVQKNVNLNIDVTTDAVMDRLKAWKEKEQVIDISNLEVQTVPEDEELKEQPVE